MPAEVESALPWILGALAAGFLFGVLITCLVVSASRARLEEKLKSAERQAAHDHQDFADGMRAQLPS